ncbi:hypothetical protein PIB30_089729 [Stylosanthes scabra]|uniref:Uncharacterized protein n=1 Tax=Stylosanthes scabra TaxID=79078 RepID=A0ABU6WXL9_9FABA|nr:hypothetical protein [Stylosanthes scabra]
MRSNPSSGRRNSSSNQNQDPPNEETSDMGENGSHLNVLHEERPKREKHPPAHSEKILRPGAGKIPQSTKKAPPPKIGPSSVSDKGKKPQHQAQNKQVSPVPVFLNSALILNRKSKSLEEEAMKVVVMEYMSQFGREQYEAFLGISLIPGNNVSGESSSGKPPNTVMEEPRNENSKAGVFARVAVKTKA